MKRISVGILLFVLLIRSNELYATNRISIFLLPISATQKQWVNLQAKHGWLWLGFDLLKLNYATFFFPSKTVSVFDDSILFKAWKSCIWISYPLKRSFIILKFHAYPCVSDWDKTHCKCKNMNIFFQFLSVANIALCLTIFHRKWFELTFAILFIQMKMYTGTCTINFNNSYWWL